MTEATQQQQLPSGSDSKESVCNGVRFLCQEDPPGEGNGYPLQYSCLKKSSLVGSCPWGHKEVHTTEPLIHTQLSFREADFEQGC